MDRCVTLLIPSLSTKFIKIATRIGQFSQYLEAKLDMSFDIAKSVEIVIILGKTYFTLKFLISCKNTSLLLPLLT